MRPKIFGLTLVSSQTACLPFMKTNPKTIDNTAGFTLMELVISITIVVTLAAIIFAVARKMKESAISAKSVQNMRQIGSILGVYAADHSLKLPPAQVKTNKGNILWFHELMSLIYPDQIDQDRMLYDKKWWEKNQPFFHNPVMTASSIRAFQPWFPGYSLNNQITNRVFTANNSADYANNESTPVPMVRISDPARTPYAVPFWNWKYTPANVSSPEMKEYLVSGKIPVLFVDGHVETVTPGEYLSRKLDDMPKRP
jgi:prepilin-type processing-associated H-X9-DG protein